MKACQIGKQVTLGLSIVKIGLRRSAVPSSSGTPDTAPVPRDAVRVRPRHGECQIDFGYLGLLCDRVTERSRMM